MTPQVGNRTPDARVHEVPDVSAKSLSCALVALFAFVAPASSFAQTHTAEAAVDGGDARAVLTLLSENASVTAGGRSHVGVHFALDPGWHVYFRNPGEAAVGTELTFRAEGARMDVARFPAPKRLVDASGTITTFGYEDEVLFVAAATIADDAAGEVRIEATADFLVCHIECIPGRVTLSRTLPVESVARAADAPTAARFANTRAALPVMAPDATFALDTRALRPGDTARAAFAVRCSECADLDRVRPDDAFFPDRVVGVSVVPVALRLEGDHAVVELSLRANPDDPRTDQIVSGLLTLPTSSGRRAFELSAALPRGRATDARIAVASPWLAAEATMGPTPAPEASLWWMLVLAFLGGLVLNVMPCVLPVLALKVFGLMAIAGDAPRIRATHALVYALGIVVTFLALAGVVIGLRSVGIAVGWGFQLQDPRFAALLAAVVVVLALGLFDVYSLGVDGTRLANEVSRTGGLPRAFGEGVLAVVLATPCSAPFLGTAVGFALSRESHVIALVFAAVGVGLATPFVLLALIPGASRILPKPGAWMIVLERLLGFVLLGTAVWLVWIVGEVTGVEGMTRALLFTLACAFATWTIASVRDAGTTPRRVVRTSALVALVASGVWLARDVPRAVAVPETSRVWSDEAVRTHLGEGRIVFVDFTAAWCITCKANERLVLGSDAVRARFADANVVTLVGDYTTHDPRIADVLARFGKAGVPLYLVYAPSSPDRPEVLPELLNESLVLRAITRAQGGSR